MVTSLAINHERSWPWFALAVLLCALLTIPGCRGDNSEENQQQGTEKEAEGLPAWVQTTPESDDLYQRFVIHSGFWTTSEETSSKQSELLKQTLRSHIDQCLNRVAGRNDAHQLLLYELEQFEKLVHISGPYLESREFSIGPMYQLHSLVEIETALDQEMARRWRHYEGRHRVRQLALGWLAIVGVLAIAFTHLRFPGQGAIARKRSWISLGLTITLCALLLVLAQWVQWI